MSSRINKIMPLVDYNSIFLKFLFSMSAQWSHCHYLMQGGDFSRCHVLGYIVNFALQNFKFENGPRAHSNWLLGITKSINDWLSLNIGAGKKVCSLSCFDGVTQQDSKQCLTVAVAGVISCILHIENCTPSVFVLITFTNLPLFETSKFLYSPPLRIALIDVIYLAAMVRNTYPHYVTDASRQRANSGQSVEQALARLEQVCREKFQVRMEELIFPEKIWLINETNLLSRFMSWGEDDGVTMINLDEFESEVLANDSTVHLFKVLHVIKTFFKQ